MSNTNLFHALSSETRMQIMKILSQNELHLSKLAKELKISKPVVSRHIKILEQSGLVNRRIIGNVHLLSANISSLENAFDPFIDEASIEVEKNTTIFDAIKQLPGVETKSKGKNHYITSINGEEGFYIYEVNGKTPKKAINEYRPQENITIQLKKLVPVNKKRIKIDFRK